ncbi:MAG: polysaccharide deacetylase family protein [Elainella sp. Prado103]|jgi:peptidoglycan/xylan/chitin deacetylase (PgdA/CDA1 family)|nr:polysaccharide deacetylase family protein [Elainella sp. Prado103]
MTYSLNTLYRPSLLELAQAGNCQALTYWINSFLAPQGVQVQIQPAPNQYLKIMVQLRHRGMLSTDMRDRLVRTICYRLWTLNSQSIRGVRIVAQQVGDSKVLWQTVVRINSPAALKRRQSEIAILRQVQLTHNLRFRIFRSLFMSGITLAGFFSSYWLFYLQMGRILEKGKPIAAPSLTDPAVNAPETASDQTATPKPIAAMGSNPADSTGVSIPTEFRGQVVSQVDLPNAEKVIALTFEDGPSDSTAQVLEILQQYGVKATFFLSGAKVKQNPEIAKQVVAAGHGIGSRGWSHRLDSSSATDMKREVDETSQLIQATTGVEPKLFRPADGRVDHAVVSYAQQQEYAVTLWSIDSQDALVAAPIVLDNVLRNAQPGRIIRLHDSPNYNGRSATLQALPQLITALQQQGYRFVSVPQLMALKATPTRDTQLPRRKPTIAAALESVQVPYQEGQVEWLP